MLTSEFTSFRENDIEIYYNQVNTFRAFFSHKPGYRFTKGLPQNFKLPHTFKASITRKSPNYIQQNLSFQASFLFY